MLRGFVGRNKGLFKLVTMVLLSLAIVFELIQELGSHSTSAIINTANLLNFVVNGGLLAVLLYCVITNDKHTRWVAMVCIAYIVLVTVTGIGNAFYGFTSQSSIYVAMSAFKFFFAVVMIAIIVLEVIRVLKGKSFELAFDIMVIALLLFSIVICCLQMAYLKQLNERWIHYFGAISNFIVVPYLVAIGYLSMTSNSKPAAKKVKKEEIEDDEIIIDADDEVEEK